MIKAFFTGSVAALLMLNPACGVTSEPVPNTAAVELNASTGQGLDLVYIVTLKNARPRMQEHCLRMGNQLLARLPKLKTVPALLGEIQYALNAASQRPDGASSSSSEAGIIHVDESGSLYYSGAFQPGARMNFDHYLRECLEITKVEGGGCPLEWTRASNPPPRGGSIEMSSSCRAVGG